MIEIDPKRRAAMDAQVHRAARARIAAGERVLTWQDHPPLWVELIVDEQDRVVAVPRPDLTKPPPAGPLARLRRLAARIVG